WEVLRAKAKISIRIHDLRHTACSKMAEVGVSEFGMLSIMGHVSRAMLERYSHVRMGAKRLAVDALCLERMDQTGVDQIGHVTVSPKVAAFQ
ncbi:MAG: tyrosine-type recombinase/integrase, partial [Acidobacteria bacterium]|nr:tyrosine-type recombinase/integrase [Acidobacteriota bacterium]